MGTHLGSDDHQLLPLFVTGPWQGCLMTSILVGETLESYVHWMTCGSLNPGPFVSFTGQLSLSSALLLLACLAFFLSLQRVYLAVTHPLSTPLLGTPRLDPQGR